MEFKLCVWQAWASKDALQNVMEVECRSLVQRLSDIEGELSDARAGRDTLTGVSRHCSELHGATCRACSELISNIRCALCMLLQELRSLETERDKWKTTCMSTSKGLEEVLEERDNLNRQLHASLEARDFVEAENERLKVGGWVWWMLNGTKASYADNCDICARNG